MRMNTQAVFCLYRIHSHATRTKIFYRRYSSSDVSGPTVTRVFVVIRHQGIFQRK